MMMIGVEEGFGRLGDGGGERSGGGGVDHRPESSIVEVFVVDGVGDWRCHLL